MRLAIVLLLVCATTVWSADSPNSESAETVADAAKQLPVQYNAKPLLFIPLLDPPKKLTGDLSDPVWKNAAAFNLQGLEKGELRPPQFATTARMFCTNDTVYLGVKCEVPDSPNTTIDRTSDRTSAWANDSMRFILFPSESCKGDKLYYQICIDPSKKAEFSRLHVYYRCGTAFAEWKPATFDCAIAKDNSSWTVEMKLNFSDLSLPSAVKEKRSLWRMALYRNREARGGLPQLKMAWTPIHADDYYYCCGRFGYLLPASCASTDLIATLIADAKGTLGPEGSRDITDLIGRLDDDDFDTRYAAMLKLKSLVDENNRGRFIQSHLKAALDATGDAEAKMRMKKILETCAICLNPDDDFPPGSDQTPSDLHDTTPVHFDDGI